MVPVHREGSWRSQLLCVEWTPKVPDALGRCQDVWIGPMLCLSPYHLALALPTGS